MCGNRRRLSGSSTTCRKWIMKQFWDERGGGRREPEPAGCPLRVTRYALPVTPRGQGLGWGVGLGVGLGVGQGNWAGRAWRFSFLRGVFFFCGARGVFFAVAVLGEAGGRRRRRQSDNEAVQRGDRSEKNMQSEGNAKNKIGWGIGLGSG